jgi:3-oxoacyl-[acyl-carrier-protein] synthase I
MAAVPITAHGVCNALGSNTEEVVAALFAGRRGLAASEASQGTGLVGALCFEPDPLPHALAPLDTRHGRLAAHVAALILDPMNAACRRWGANRVGIVVGSGVGSLAATEQAYAHMREHGCMPPSWNLERDHCMQAAIDVLQYVTGARGPAFAVSTSCASSGKALGSAQRLISSGLVEAVLVAGIDTLCSTMLRSFAELEVSSPRACRPLSSAREGLNLGEGAAVLLLERTGAADVALISVGECSDAPHPGASHHDGLGARIAMKQALDRAGIAASRVGHVNVHATGTPRGDFAEASALRSVFGDGARVVATKGYTGHLLGAAGATEAVFAAIAIERGWLPASVGADPVDPQLGLRVVCERTQLESDYAMSTSHSFGGSNVAVIVGARDR